MRADPLTVTPSDKRPADRDRQPAEFIWIAAGEEAENLETDRAKKPAVRFKARISSRRPEFTLGILDRLLTRLRPVNTLTTS